MLQTHLPIFPNEVTNITSELAFKKEDGVVTYFNFSMPIFRHNENELATFRMITSQFCVNKNATQSQIARAFGVTLVSVKRWVKVYKEKGPKGFYEPRNTRGAVVLTAIKLQEAQDLLSKGIAVREIAKQLSLKANTISKAIRAGRLYCPAKKKKKKQPQ